MSRPLRIAIAGLGTVGASLAKNLHEAADMIERRAGRPIELVAVSARSPRQIPGARFESDPMALALAGDVDVYVELMGGAEGIARQSVVAALQSGKTVITANKALLAAHGVELARLAEKNRVGLHFEAAVAGGIPIVKALREGLTGNQVRRVYGIMNGTCNYILTRMEREGLTFEACLADAQRLGYAEADPTFDVDGFDTAHKLALLTSLSFATRVAADQMYIEGIRTITLDDVRAADELGYRIKLLGIAQRTDSGIEQRVHPTMVRKGTALAEVHGVTNAVAVDADLVGSLVLVGPGAGGNATSSAALADLVDVARGTKVKPFGKSVSKLSAYRRAKIDAHEGAYYIRLGVYDRAGSFAGIAKRMAAMGISLESIVQRGKPGKDESAVQPVTLITHATAESGIRRALARIEADGHIAAKPQMIRIESL
jgi:homoserine dehydrogenase